MKISSLIKKMAKLGYSPEPVNTPPDVTFRKYQHVMFVEVSRFGEITELIVDDTLYYTIREAIRAFIQQQRLISLNGPWTLFVATTYIADVLLYSVNIRSNSDSPFSLEAHEVKDELKGILKRMFDTGEKANGVILDWLKEHYPELDRFQLG